MNSQQKFLDHLNQMINNLLERPQMYASSPESLEESLMLLDGIRSWLLEGSHDEDSVFPLCYRQFLIKRGLEANTLCGSKRHLQSPSDEDRKLFDKLVAFWSEYEAGRGA